MKWKLIRSSTIPSSLDILLRGQLAFLNERFDVVAVSGAGLHLENVSNREKVDTKPIGMKRKISLFHDMVSLIKLYIFFKKEEPLIVHSITPKAGLLSMVAAYFAGVPIRMHTFTGLIFPSEKGFKRRILVAMDRLLCLFATHIYPEGNGVKNDLTKFKITNRPLKVLANGNINGIDTDFFNICHFDDKFKIGFRGKVNINASDFVFVFVGRLVKDKGVKELIKAFQNLHQTCSKIKLLLVGAFENAIDPLDKETIKAIKADPDIISVGYQNDVRPYLAISNVLLLPSYREGFPNVVLQAGAMGLPCVVSDINGCNEIILDNVNGFIVPSKNVELLLQRMRRLVEDETCYLKFATKAREMIVNRYKQEFVWNAILKEYETAINELAVTNC